VSSGLRMPLGGDRMTGIDNLLFSSSIPSDIRMASKSMEKLNVSSGRQARITAI